MSYAGTFKWDLYERLDANKSGATTVISSNNWYSSMLQELKNNQSPVSLAIGAGWAWGTISFQLAKWLLDAGIKPTEYVGNSVGAIIGTLLAQWYTDIKYIDFFFSWISGAKDLTLPVLASKLIPFTFILNEQDQEELITRNKEFMVFLNSHKQELDKSIKSWELSGVIKLTSEFLWIDLGTNRSLTFNDIQKKHGTKLAIQASVIATKSGLLNKIRTKNNGKWNKWHDNLLRSITFRGGYDVFSALIASASPHGIQTTQVKWQSFKTTDGYWSGQWFAHKWSDFSEKWSKKVLIHTDDNFLLTKKFTPNYWSEINYVIRPDVREWWAFDFSAMARERNQKKVNDILWK